ncbi:uncharacterized protein LOC123476948 [Daphnia magna]|uniref:uncharacterized protein LOC123476948 n=1 Tax=Daphnia magna TaxID=35525 RepID=UPI001E1BC0AB|nr:uncharacterized protein LOC123476948 [Daphnia magna]
MARVLEHVGRFIGPLPELHRDSYRLSPAIRIEIIRLYRNNFGSAKRIAKHLNIHKVSVVRWIDRYEERKNLEPKINVNGQPRHTTENEDFLLACSAVLNNFSNSRDIAAHVRLDHLSKNSITRRLNNCGMNSRIAAVKDILTEEHRAARLHFARRYVHYPLEFWRWVVFTDEKSCSAIHNARHTREWLALHPQLIALDWPTKGADMSPIENILGYLVCKLTKSRTGDGLPYHARDANNANLLFELVRNEWEKLADNENILQHLIESMPERLQKVIDAEGGWTRY